MGRRRYSEEYKREAVTMTRLPGATLQQVACDLRHNANMLGRWRKALEEHGDHVFPGHGHARDAEIMRLKRELAKVTKERDFLKDAATFFAKASKCSMSAVGSCADNALVEGFFGMFKRERINRRRDATRAQARSDIFDYIERFYNPRMRHRLENQKLKGDTLNLPVRKIGA